MVCLAFSGIILALFVGLGVSLWQAKRARQAKQEAEASAGQAEQERLRALSAESEAKEKQRRLEAVLERNLASQYAIDLALASEAVKNKAYLQADTILSAYEKDDSKSSLIGWEWKYLKGICDHRVSEVIGDIFRGGKLEHGP